MVYLQTTYKLCFGEAYIEYFESCDFSRENTLHFVGHDNIFKTKKIYAFTNVYKN